VQSARSVFARFTQPAVLPVITYLCAYIGTSVLGAVVLLTEFGQTQAKIFLPSFEPAQMQTFGSTLYLAVLLAPLVVVPAFAFIGLRAGDRAVRYLPQFKIADPSTGMLYALMVVFSGWCFYKVVTTGYPIPELLFDRTKGCDARIVRRIELFTQFRYVFYAFVYSALPVVSTLFLVKAIRGRRAADFIGFGISFVLIFYFYASIYMKSPFLVYFLTLLIGLLAAGVRWWKAIVIFGCLAIVVFVASYMILDCTDYREVIAIERQERQEQQERQERKTTTGLPGVRGVRVPSEGAASMPHSKIVATVLPMARSLAFRMAMAFPYYVEIFEDPTERCGIEDNRIPLLPRQTCFPASKIFSVMYPDITYVQGQAPAAAHISALAEFGPWFSFLVMIGCGLVLGIAAQFVRLCEPILGAGMIAATAVFAYQLTQVPFVGALSYGQGYIAFLLPVILIAAIPLLSRAILGPIARWFGSTPRRLLNGPHRRRSK
jgi:hypothetical protein